MVSFVSGGSDLLQFAICEGDKAKDRALSATLSVERKKPKLDQVLFWD
jgi:hypothetical protein